MDSDIVVNLIIVIILIVVNGVFSMTELAIVNARKGKLEEEVETKDSAGAKRALALAEDPNNMFSTIQIGITLVSIVTGLYSGATFSDPMANGIKEAWPSLAPYADSISPIIIVGLTTYFSLIIGELVPKRLAYNAPERVAILMGRPMHIFSLIARPLVVLLSWSTELIMRLMGIRKKVEAPITESEINKMLKEGVALGAFEAEEPELVDNIFRFADLSAVDVMTPRTQIVWLDANEPEEELLTILQTTNHSRLPVGADSLDDAKGIVSVADVLRAQLEDKNKEQHRDQQGDEDRRSLYEIIEEASTQPLLIPESLTLVKLVRLFQTEGIHEAFVLDEFGGFSGLVTLHDLMEGIVGCLPSGEEEKKEEESRIQKRSDTTWLVDGLTNIDDFKEYFHIQKEWPGEEEDFYKTMGGFVTYLLGRLPKEMDRCQWEAFTFEIIDMDNRRVDKILLTYKEVEDVSSETTPEES